MGVVSLLSGETTSFILEVAKGNVEGHSLLTVSGSNPNTEQSFSDVSDVGALFTLSYDAQTGNFTAGLILTQTPSGATARIVIDDDDGTTGTLTIRNITGTFVNDQVIADSGSGSATADGVTSCLGVVNLPSAGSQWEVICESPDDAIAGTGAQVVNLQYLDSNYVLQSTSIDLSGATPATTTPTDILRFRRLSVIQWGADTDPLFGKGNKGYIVIRDSSGNPQGTIALDDAVAGDEHGLNISRTSISTIEAGKTGFLVQFIVNTPKDDEAETAFLSRPFGLDGFFEAAEQNIYQTTAVLPREAPGGITGKSDVRLIARSTINPSVSVNITYDLLLVDSNLTDTAAMSQLI